LIGLRGIGIGSRSTVGIENGSPLGPDGGVNVGQREKKAVKVRRRMMLSTKRTLSSQLPNKAI